MGATEERSFRHAARGLAVVLIILNASVPFNPTSTATPRSTTARLDSAGPIDVQDGAAEDLVCTPRSSKHLEAVYAVPAGTPDLSVVRLSQLEDEIYAAAAHVRGEARTMGGAARLKFLCDKDGTIATTTVAVPQPRYFEYDELVADLKEAGLDRPNVKYVVFFESCIDVCAVEGQATMEDDSRPGSKNLNNRGPSFAINFQGTWKRPTAFVLLHELLHALGAVQKDAPHNSGGFHCSDTNDMLCVGVGPEFACGELPGNAPSYVDHAEGGHMWPIDCGGDDYFNPRPDPGSYLATHWNIALHSDFLASR